MIIESLNDCYMKYFTSHIKSLLIYQCVTLLSIHLYLKLSHNWTPISSTGDEIFRIEIPFLMLLLIALYFPSINNKIIRFVFPIMPILVLYSLFDLFYDYFGRSPRPSDFQNFHTIFGFSPELAAGLIFYALLAPLIIFALLYLAYKGRSPKSTFISMTSRLSMASLLIMLLLSNAAAEYTKTHFKEVAWSQELTIKENSRLSSFIYYGIKEKENLTALYEHKPSPSRDGIYKKLYPGYLPNKRNVHIVVLESFIDPRLLKDVVFNKSPLAAELKTYFPKGRGDFSHVISPVYGGGTPQSEFELLSGIKALSKIASMEFNVMNGGTSSSLVNRLKELNYTPIVTLATNSGFYNSTQAYKSLGFDDVTYLEESGYKIRDGDQYIFDGDAFDYSFNEIKQHIENEATPVFSYVLGMYGHIPFERNISIRPNVVDAEHKDKRIHLISNQFYYRTKAISNYIKQLLAIDPNSIIYITSDHLPPLLGADIKYKVNNKINIALLLDGGKPVDVTGMHYYEIPWLLWDLLSNNKNNREFNEMEMEKLYFQFLHESITKM